MKTNHYRLHFVIVQTIPFKQKNRPQIKKQSICGSTDSADNSFYVKKISPEMTKTRVRDRSWEDCKHRIHKMPLKVKQGRQHSTQNMSFPANNLPQ